MKRIAAFAVILIGVFIVGMAAVPFLVSGEFLKRRIADQISAWTGRPVTISGNPTLSFYPYVSVNVDGIVIAGNDDATADIALLEADSLRATLKRFPLLTGTVEFEEFELNQPLIRLVNRKEGGPNWHLGGVILAHAKAQSTTSTELRSLGKGADIPIGRIRIHDGRVQIEDRVSEWREEISSLDLDLQWPEAADGIRGNGNFVWRGVPADFNGSLEKPLNLLAGGTSPARLALASVTARIGFHGTVDTTSTLTAEGRTTAATPSLRATISWLGTDTGTGAILGPAAISGQMRWQGSHISFEQANLELDGNSASGALSLLLSGERPHLTADISTQALDLTPYVEAARGDLLAREPWLLAPAQLPFTHYLDANIRISATQAIIGSVHTVDMNARLRTENGALTLDIENTRFYGGTLTGQLNTNTEDGYLTASLQTKMEDVPAGVALNDIAGVNALDGRATISLHLETRGRSWGEMLRTASGSARAQIKDGVVNGFNLLELAEIISDPLAEVTPSSARTGFYDLSTRVNINEGSLVTDDLSLTGSGYRMSLSGRGSLVTGLLDANALLSTRSTDAPLAIYGNWNAPLVVRDLERPRPATSLLDESEGG